MMDIKEVLLQCFSKKLATSAGPVESNIMLNQQLAEELQKPIITLISFRQYLGCWSRRYAVEK